jgi:glycine cleavage system H protein|tara:strand:+ start:66 stop:446 length:381 start_codon:yes stop_codon:yes gene_type:complete
MADLKFTKSHEWVNIEDSRAKIGITDYAQSQLGDIVFIELPQKGDRIEKSSQLGTIESTKAASELYAPLTGEVVEVNEDLINNPQWINESAQDRGWMLKIRMEKSQEIETLIDEVAYKEFIEKEAH